MPVVFPLAGVLVAIIIILILIAAWVFAELLARVFSGVPFIGGWVATSLRVAVNATATFVGRTWDGAISDLGWLFAAIAVWGWEWLYAHSRALGHAVGLGARAEGDAAAAIAMIGPAAAHAISVAEGAAQGLVNGAVNELTGTIDRAVAGAEAIAATEVQTAITGAENLFNQAEHDLSVFEGVATAGLGALTGRVANLEAAVTGDVQSLVTDIKADLNIAIATAEQAANAAEQAAIQAANGLAQGAAAGAVGALDLAAHDLVIGPWSVLIPEVEQIVTGLPAETAGALHLPDILAGSVPAAVPGILAYLASITAGVAAEVANCLVPNCSALKEAGTLFNGLEQLGVAAVLMALVGEAIADPEAAAGQFLDVTGWIPDVAVEAVNGVVG